MYWYGAKRGQFSFCSFAGFQMFRRKEEALCSKLYHLTSCFCKLQCAPSLGGVYCTGQAKCVSIQHERPGISQGWISTKRPLAYCRALQSNENKSSSMNVCEEVYITWSQDIEIWENCIVSRFLSYKLLVIFLLNKTNKNQVRMCC